VSEVSVPAGSGGEGGKSRTGIAQRRAGPVCTGGMGGALLVSRLLRCKVRDFASDTRLLQIYESQGCAKSRHESFSTRKFIGRSLKSAKTVRSNRRNGGLTNKGGCADKMRARTIAEQVLPRGRRHLYYFRANIGYQVPDHADYCSKIAKWDRPMI
jgi:hypothetical protein